MKKIVINGDFFCRNLTGIERFAYEVCKRLDKIVDKDSITIYVPANAKNVCEFQNIKILRSKKECKVFPLWEHGTFSRFLKKEKAFPLDFSNATPLFKPGIVFIHDIYAKTHPEDFTSRKDTLIRLYMCTMYRHCIRHAKKIITVSAFSRKEICENYKISEDKISIIYNGWEHLNDIQEDSSVLDAHPELKKGQFFFTLGSLQKRKNLKWISEYASKHPEDIFAISGKAISGMVSDDIAALQTLKNVVLLGYVSDGQVKALMKNCRAFVFPSYYEGFGIPPLEALSCGAKIIIGNAASLPELYGKTAHYIDCNNTDVSLNELLEEKTEDADAILKKYSYDNAARELKKLLEEF